MMVYALLLFLLLGLIIYIIDSLYNVVIFLGMFFVDSFWGLATIISGSITALLFYAASKTYIDSFFKNLKHNKKSNLELNSSSLMKNSNDLEIQHNVNEIDLSNVTLDGMVSQMTYLMTKPGPVFFKGWGNRRLLLDVERVHIMTSYIEAVRSAGSSLAEFQADAVLSYEKIKALTEIKYNDLKTQIEESRLRLDLVSAQYKHQISELKLDIKLKQADLDQKLVEIDSMRSQINIRERELAMQEKMNDVRTKVLEVKMNDDSTFNKARAGLLDKIIEEMDMNNINPSQAFVLINALSPGSTDDINFQTRSEMVKQELEKMKAETKYKYAEADEREAEANEKKAQSKSNIFDLRQNKKERD